MNITSIFYFPHFWHSHAASILPCQLWQLSKISKKYFYHFSNIENDMKSMNSSVHKHVHHRQTTKCCAYEIKWFHSKRVPYKRTLQYIHSLLRNTQSVHSPLMVVLVGVWRRGASSRNTVYRNDRALNRTTAPATQKVVLKNQTMNIYNLRTTN